MEEIIPGAWWHGRTYMNSAACGNSLPLMKKVLGFFSPSVSAVFNELLVRRVSLLIFLLQKGILHSRHMAKIGQTHA